VKTWKDNITFVLVGPREPGNIGASARALKNMGFSRLSLVNPVALTDETKWFAHNSLDILKTATAHASLDDAICDNAIIAGTTRRKGKSRGLIYPVRQGVRQLYSMARENKVAILFGREDRGLFNDEVEECGFLLSIPADNRHPSLNLAQAVLIVAYELSRAEYEGAGSEQQPEECAARLVPHKELQLLYMRISETLKLLQYIPAGDRDIERKIMANLKHFIGRAGITEWELGMMHGICTRIELRLEDAKTAVTKKNKVVN